MAINKGVLELEKKRATFLPHFFDKKKGRFFSTSLSLSREKKKKKNTKNDFEDYLLSGDDDDVNDVNDFGGGLFGALKAHKREVFPAA